MHLHVEKCQKNWRRLELCQWSGLLLRGSSPLVAPAMVASARGLQGRAYARSAAPCFPDCQVRHWSRHPPRKNREMIFAEVVLSVRTSYSHSISYLSHNSPLFGQDATSSTFDVCCVVLSRMILDLSIPFHSFFLKRPTLIGGLRRPRKAKCGFH
jgi:hypothetical protein